MPANAPKFQELAVALISSVKGLMAFTHHQNPISDKDVEAKLGVIFQVLKMCQSLSSEMNKEHGASNYQFRLPENMV